MPGTVITSVAVAPAAHPAAPAHRGKLRRGPIDVVVRQEAQKEMAGLPPALVAAAAACSARMGHGSASAVVLPAKIPTARCDRKVELAVHVARVRHHLRV